MISHMTSLIKLLPWKRQNLGLFKFRDFASSSENSDEKKASKKHWRKTREEEGEWSSSLRLFEPKEKSETGILKLIQTPIDLRPIAIRRWLERKKIELEKLNQRFIKERHEALGKDLASAHFILYRGGRIRFYNEEKWHVELNSDIPNKYIPGIFVEAIDASNVNLYYEGLHNLFGLKCLKWLNLNNSQHIDDWCLDYISGEFGQTLEYLDIGNCQNITERGLASLYRMKKLKFLNVINIPTSNHFELSCLLLEDVHNDLKIEGIKYMKR